MHRSPVTVVRAASVAALAASLAGAGACTATPGHCHTGGVDIDGLPPCSETDATTDPSAGTMTGAPSTSDDSTTSDATSEGPTSATDPTSTSLTTSATSEGPTSSSGPMTGSVCGDGVKDEGEECDDGNDDNTDLCTNACTKAACGDGFTQPDVGEVCDPAELNLPAACDDMCVWETCGDGVDDPHEDCDWKVDPEICTETCQWTPGARSVASGLAHTCALLWSGAVRCWGEGDDGRLGYGGTDDIGGAPDSLPTEDIDFGDPDVEMVAVAVGDAHSCALSSDGEVYCWGANDQGQLGLGHTDSIGDDAGETPAMGGPLPLPPVAEVAAGARHTCVLFTGGDMGLCWGRGAEGQLLNQSTANLGDDETLDTFTALQFPEPAHGITAGGDHGCALWGMMPQPRCWGRNDHGQLGHNNIQNYGGAIDHLVEAIPAVGFDGATLVVDAGRDSTCALIQAVASVDVKCWGRGSDGRLGHGSEQNIGDDNVPVNTASPIALGGNGVLLGTGDRHACALVEGVGVRCWGFGGDGRLGYGDELNVGDVMNALPEQFGPVEIGLSGPVAELSLGGGHSCARSDVGALRCWGLGASGQLGTGSLESVGDDELPADGDDVALDP